MLPMYAPLHEGPDSTQIVLYDALSFSPKHCLSVFPVFFLFDLFIQNVKYGNLYFLKKL